MALFTDGVFSDVGGGSVTGTSTHVAFFGGAGTLTTEAAFTYDPSTNTLFVGSGQLIIDGPIGAGASPTGVDQLLVQTGGELQLHNKNTSASLYAHFKNSATARAFDIYTGGSGYPGSTPFFGETLTNATHLVSDGKLVIGTTGSDAFKLATSNLVRVEIASGGDVGIGGTPSYSLDTRLTKSGTSVTSAARNLSNTASSSACFLAEVAGGTAADPVSQWSVSGVTSWTMGIDNSNATAAVFEDAWKLSSGSALDITNAYLTAGVYVTTKHVVFGPEFAAGQYGNSYVTIGGATGLPGAGFYAASSSSEQTALMLAARGASAGSDVALEFAPASGVSSPLAVGGGGSKIVSGYTVSGDQYRFDFFTKIAGSYVQRLKLHANGVSIFPGGTAGESFVGAVCKTIQNDSGNVGAGEDNLHVTAIPANYMAAAGASVELECAFSFAANANNKRVRLYFGATAIYDTGAVAQNGGGCVIRARIVRTSDTAQRAYAWLASSASATLVADVQHTSPAETLTSGNITIKSTGEATSDNDVVAKVLLLNFVPGNN